MYGPGANDSVTICPDDDYILIFHCVVTGSIAFEWTLDSVIEPFLVTQSDQPGEYTEMFVTVVITEQDLVAQRFESRFQVPTRELRAALGQRATPLEVVCKTRSTTKTIRISGTTYHCECFADIFVTHCRWLD